MLSATRLLSICRHTIKLSSSGEAVSIRLGTSGSLYLPLTFVPSMHHILPPNLSIVYDISEWFQIIRFKVSMAEHSHSNEECLL